MVWCASLASEFCAKNNFLGRGYDAPARLILDAHLQLGAVNYISSQFIIWDCFTRSSKTTLHIDGLCP